MHELTIPAMSCGHCQKTIAAAVRELDDAAKLSFDMAAHKITLDTTADLSAIKRALDAAGYPAQVAGSSGR